MSTIQLDVSEIQSLKKRISKMIDEIDDCYREVNKISNQIDMKVKRRKDIDADLLQIKNDLKKQKEFLTQCEKLIGESINDFVEAEKIDHLPDLKFSVRSVGGSSNYKVNNAFANLLLGTGFVSLATLMKFFMRAKKVPDVVKIADYPSISEYINEKFPNLKNNSSTVVSAATVEEKEHGGSGKSFDEKSHSGTGKSFENNSTSNEDASGEKGETTQKEQLTKEQSEYQERLDMANSLETQKQPYSGPCPQYATLNLLRRKEMLEKGSTSVTIDNVVDSNGGNLNYAKWVKDMCGYDMKVERGMQLEGSKSTVTTEHFNELLESHPEGVVMYSKYADGKYHAITVTDYNAETGQYYVMDSAGSSKGVVPFEDSWMSTKLGTMDEMLKNCNKIYYIK